MTDCFMFLFDHRKVLQDVSRCLSTSVKVFPIFYKQLLLKSLSDNNEVIIIIRIIIIRVVLYSV